MSECDLTVLFQCNFGKVGGYVQGAETEGSRLQEMWYEFYPISIRELLLALKS